MSRLEEQTCDEMSKKWSGWARNGTLDDNVVDLDEVKSEMKKDADWIWQMDSYAKSAKSMLGEEDL